MRPFNILDGCFNLKNMSKKTKKLLSWGVGIAFLACITAFVVMGNGNSDQTNRAQYSASVLDALEKTFDFNTISMKDGNVSHQFEIRNDGVEPVVIEKVYTSCMCTTAYITDSSGKRYGEFGMPGHTGSSGTKIEVAPGEAANVEAIFDPNAHGPSGVGFIQRSVYLETNSAASPKMEFSFQATVVR